MLSVFACIVGVLAILLIAEVLWKNKTLRHEYHRKFVHMGVGSFAAFWPWLMSWRSIQLLGLAMAFGVLIDRQLRVFKIDGRIRRQTYGDILFALAITFCALLTTNKVFFMIAVLHLAIADGLAAILGITYGMRWKYKVFGETRTLVGTFSFWTASMLILATGLLFILPPSLATYTLMVVGLPPLLSFLENISVRGLDNFVVTSAVIVTLQLFY